MRYINNLIFLICFLLGFYASQAQSLDSAFSLDACYINDMAYNFSGGLNTGFSGLGMINLNINFRTEDAGLWKGGKFLFNVQNTHGGRPSESYIGDLQVASNIENGNYTYLYQLWYKQTFNKLSLIVGIDDMNADFDADDYCSTFINSSFGVIPTISGNIPIPIFPKNTLGVIGRYDFSDIFSFQTALYDGDPGSLTDNIYHYNLSISSKQGFLSISELQVSNNLNSNLISNYKFGFYYHTAEFPSYKDTLNTVHGNYGIYFVGDWCLNQKATDSEKGLKLFLQFGWAPSKFNKYDIYVGPGINYIGLLPNRSQDVLGLGIAYDHISQYFRDLLNNEQLLTNETAVELTYKAFFFDWLCIQPDLQYIINPGATSNLKNTTTGFIRTYITF